jgi:hypothetical protein
MIDRRVLLSQSRSAIEAQGAKRIPKTVDGVMAHMRGGDIGLDQGIGGRDDEKGVDRGTGATAIVTEGIETSEE